MKKVKGLLIIVAILAILWGTGIVPKMIGRYTAEKYVEENYKDTYLTLDSINYSKEYGDYIVRFKKESNSNIYNLRVSPIYFPTTVVYDSIKESNV